MLLEGQSTDLPGGQPSPVHPKSDPVPPNPSKSRKWTRPFKKSKSKSTPTMKKEHSAATSVDGEEDIKGRPEKWSLGVLNDRETDEVPGM